MDLSLPLLPIIIIAISIGLIYGVTTFALTRLFGGRKFLAGILASAFLYVVIFAGLRSDFQTKTGFVILYNKVGHPVVATMFRVEPEESKKDKNYCHVYSDKLYSHYNVSVFTAAQEGDVLRRYHYTNSYKIFKKTIWQDCYEVYMPIILVALYPDMNYWPFREGDLKPGDPDYERIAKLTKSQR